MVCKGICTRYKAEKPVGTGRYAAGQKRCQICNIFLKWDGLWCPCCGYRLRTKPRHARYKIRLKEKGKVEEKEEEKQLLLKQKEKEKGEEKSSSSNSSNSREPTVEEVMKILAALRERVVEELRLRRGW